MPQADFQEKEIDGVRYTIRMLPPRKAQAILLEMVKVAGPSFAEIASNVKPGVSFEDSEMDFGRIVGLLAEKLDQRMLDDHQAAFASVTEADGVLLKGIFDKHFHGRVMSMLKWHAFAIQANFADFSDALGTVFSRINSKAKPEAGSKSLNISTGESGD